MRISYRGVTWCLVQLKETLKTFLAGTKCCLTDYYHNPLNVGGHQRVQVPVAGSQSPPWCFTTYCCNRYLINVGSIEG